MSENEEGKAHLRVIAGGRDRHIDVGRLRVVAGPVGRPPFAVGGIICEEDTFLVMSADGEVREPDGDLVRIVAGAYSTLPHQPGSVVVQEGKPVRLLAVVHDLNLEPSCRKEWVLAACRNSLLLADRRKLHHIAMPLLGSVHGVLDWETAIDLLADVLAELHVEYLQRLWLLVPETDRLTVLDRLEEVLARARH